jgi:hypothetical protein
VVLVLALELSVPVEKVLAGMSDESLAPNLARMGAGVVALIRKIPGLSETQYVAMMRDGAFGYRSLLAPAKPKQTVGALMNYVSTIVSQSK